MTVAEMHIAVNQGVQKIASHQVGVLLPQEIDFELNKAQDKFVKNRYNQFGNKYSRGFEGSQKRIDDLRNLVTEKSVITTYKGQVSDNIYVDTAILPEDDGYMFLLNHRSFVVHNNCDSIEPCMVYNTLDPVVWVEIDFEEFSLNNYGDVVNGAPFVWVAQAIYGSNWSQPTQISIPSSSYTQLNIGDEVSSVSSNITIPPGTTIIALPGSPVVELSNNPTIVSGPNAQTFNAQITSSGSVTPTPTPIHSIQIAVIDDAGNHLLAYPFNQTMSQLGCAAMNNYLDSQYWSPGWSVYLNANPNGMPPTYTSANGGLVLGFTLPPNWVIDYTPGAITASYPSCFIQVIRVDCGPPFDILHSSIDYINPSSGLYIGSAPSDNRYCTDIKYTASSVNRYSQLDDIYTLLKDPFNKTKHTSPLTTIVGHNIDIYTDETFYVPKVKLTYIKKPRSIDSTSGSVTSCELAEHTHQEIVDMAVASILEEIADPRYQTNRMEELRSE